MKEATRNKRTTTSQNARFELNGEQKEAKRLILENQLTVVTGMAGCLGLGTEVLMYDGYFKKVEDVIVGDRLMGPDSTPRTVLSLCRGVDQMYWVRQNRGVDYRVNSDHILSLQIYDNTQLLIPVKEFIQKSKNYQEQCFGYSVDKSTYFYSSITIEQDIVDDYYGFTLDGDHLFLLKDLTVTHNSGKSLVCAEVGLDLLMRKQCEKILVCRAAIEVGKTLGNLPGNLGDKFNPYIEGFVENLNKLIEKERIKEMVNRGLLEGVPVQFIRGKTIDDYLVCEEAQNLTKHEMLAILTRLGKTGKMVINGDNNQQDIKCNGEMNGLQYILTMAKSIPEIKVINLLENHRSGLVGKILDYEYGISSI